MLTPKIETSTTKNLVGICTGNSLANDQTSALWRNFRSRLAEIPDRLTTDRFSVQLYPPHYFEAFSPEKTFEKWAAVEVGPECLLPDGMRFLLIPQGKYAVFVHKGTPDQFRQTWQGMMTWLAQSDFQLDQRPHFEVMPEHYDPFSPNSEEEIWLPICPKS